MSHPDPTARDLIQRLAVTLERAQNVLHYEGACTDATDKTRRNLLAEARAYLAQPEPFELTDAELLELMPETMRDEFAACASTYSAATGGQVKPGIFRTCLNTAALDYARAILARYGGDV